MDDRSNFQQIVDSVSIDSILIPCSYSTNTTMNVDEQKKELAYVARMISKGHAGYELWGEEIKRKFEMSIEDIYNAISTPNDVKSFYKKLDKSLQILPDEHLKVSPSKGNLLSREPNTVSVGGNLCQDKSKKWEIIPSDDGEICTIALPELGSATPNDWLAFSNELDVKLFNQDGSEKYNALIVDVRSNPGGAAVPFELLAKKLYGNDVAPFEKSSYRDTKEADYLRFVNGEISRETFDDRVNNHIYTGKMVEICDYSSHKNDYPPFAKGGYRKPIIILTNRETSSAGESLCQSLKYHPGVTYIGENTAGCYAEISGEAFRGKFGYGVKIGSTHASFENNEIFERKGFPVDINTSGQDAYLYALDNINDIKKQANERIAKYTPPITKKEFNKLANNDFAFIRAINTGMEVEQVKELYEAIYPDKKDNFPSIVEYANKGTFSKKTTESNEAKSNEVKSLIMALRGVSDSNKVSYNLQQTTKPQQTTINPQILRRYQIKKQNG